MTDVESKPPDWSTLLAYINQSDRRDVVITSTDQERHLPSGVGWIDYGPFNQLIADVAFGPNDARLVPETIRRRGYYRGRVKRVLRSA